MMLTQPPLSPFLAWEQTLLEEIKDVDSFKATNFKRALSNNYLKSSAPSLHSQHLSLPSTRLFVFYNSDESSLTPLSSSHSPALSLVHDEWDFSSMRSVLPLVPYILSCCHHPQHFYHFLLKSHINSIRKAYWFCLQALFKIQPFLTITTATTSTKTQSSLN